MKYLKIIWIRIIVSLIGGGMATELIHISTGNPNRPMVQNHSLLYGIVIYIILSAIIKYRENKNL